MVDVWVESVGGELSTRAWAAAPSGDSFFIVLVIILEEEEDDGSHEDSKGTAADLNGTFDLGFDLESGTDDVDFDLVFLVNLSDFDWPVFFLFRLLKEVRNRNRQKKTHVITSPLPRVQSHAYFKRRRSCVGGKGIVDDVFLSLLLDHYMMTVQFVMIMGDK